MPVFGYDITSNYSQACPTSSRMGIVVPNIVKVSMKEIAL